MDGKPFVDKDFTVAWWERVVADEARLQAWLSKLYCTEFDGFADNQTANQKWNKDNNKFIERIFKTTANDELGHAWLLEDLIRNRGWDIPNPAMNKTPSIYWTIMDEGIVDLKTCCAVFHLGEQLAAERFEIILENKHTPMDVCFFLKQALPEEQYHAAAFKYLAGEEAIAAMLELHHKALDATLTSRR